VFRCAAGCAPASREGTSTAVSTEVPRLVSILTISVTAAISRPCHVICSGAVIFALILSRENIGKTDGLSRLTSRFTTILSRKD
jgi:hypothetical protein